MAGGGCKTETEAAASSTGSGSPGRRKWWAFWVICCLYPAGAGSLAEFAARLSHPMALETVPKDLRHLRACLLCSLVKVCLGDLGGGRWRGMREAAGRHC